LIKVDKNDLINDQACRLWQTTYAGMLKISGKPYITAIGEISTTR
jgi:hypothetical protein